MPSSDIFIDQVGLYSSRIKLKQPFVISLGQLDFAEHVIVVIQTNTGITGFGECNPFRTIHGETTGTGMMVGHDLAKLLLGENPMEIEACSTLMDAFIYGNSSIKSAFDIALHDIASQQAGVPLYKFLGGKNNIKIQTDFTISLGEPEKMAADAIRILESGFSIIKVKLGGPVETDIARIRFIREAIGMDIILRIDANQGWNKEDAIHILNALSPFQIQHCEEPVPRWNFMELAEIRSRSPIPIMADESCMDHHDAKRLIDLKSCDSINIKLGKSSGILKAMKIIRLAEDFSINLQAGGFLESRLGFTASAHVALCSDRIIHYDFDTPLMFSEDPVSGGISYGKNGLITVPDSPGLGASYDRSFLDKLKKVIVQN